MTTAIELFAWPTSKAWKQLKDPKKVDIYKITFFDEFYFHRNDGVYTALKVVMIIIDIWNLRIFALLVVPAP